MKKFHQVLQIVLLVYFLLYLVFFMAFDTLGGLCGMQEVTSQSMVTILLIGFVLFLINWGIGKAVSSSQNSKINKMEIEINKLKAKIYDFEHPDLPEKPKSAPTKSSEPESGTLPPRQNFTKD